ncbi:MAG: bifunctional demethylmenaquinone methyltransferase/2-methoxy-6-polyprenyl-1,4-benzoquinol methylase UbiE [Coriobacteriia bacterium]|nr:bifunctional demethylmenaquinone methyltransferase/2-methoxy-6-polyprenyl-1,4-benzoquinol methylase UbiE [Coriobacteriia bacterium]
MSAVRRTVPESGKPTTEKVQSIFQVLAPDYDRFNRLSSLGIDRSWRKRAVRLARVSRDSVVLDLAAGTGDLTMELAERGRPASVLATDFVEEMLDVARAKAAGYQGETVIDFAVADAQDLPFEDERFDVVTVGFGVRNLPDRSANFREVYRVLKPGGRYVVLEMSRPPFGPFRSLYHFYLHTVIPTLGGLLTGHRGSFEYLRDSILAFPGQVALAGELHKAGFREVTWRNLTFGIVAVHVAVK